MSGNKMLGDLTDNEKKNKCSIYLIKYLSLIVKMK